MALLGILSLLAANQFVPATGADAEPPAYASRMTFPGEQWEETTPESQGLDAARLGAAVDYLRAHTPRDGVRELVIIRNGRMVWRGDNIDHRHGVWSCTKSFTSTVLGLLIADGRCELDSKAARFLPSLRKHYRDVTLRHFATMTSGYRAIGDEPRGSYRHGPSPTPFLPSPEPLFQPPGSQYAYWDSAMNCFGLVLTKIAGESMEQLFARRIAEPIGMNPDAWDWGDLDTLDGLVVNGGSGNSNRHLFISAREFARLGHLFLNEGYWNGKPLLSAAWVRNATSMHVPKDIPWAQPESGIDGRGVYGLNWWVNGLTPKGQPKWPGAPTGTYAASGHNNNKLIVIPEWRMVIVRLGLDQDDFKVPDTTWGEFLRRIGAARLRHDNRSVDASGRPVLNHQPKG